MLIFGNNDEPLIENGESLIFKKNWIATVNCLARSDRQNLSYKSLKINS